MGEMILEDVMAARARIKPYIHKTPLLHSARISKLLGCEVFVKCENLQKTGSFKARGVMNFLLQNPGSGPVTTFSSGNHGGALAWGANMLNRPSVIFMPEDCSAVKVAAIRGYKGEVRFAGLSSKHRYDACHAYAAQVGAIIAPPFDHEHIIAGQGTVLLEVLEDLPHVDSVFIPLGGGGLLSGNALVGHNLRPNLEVIGCEPERAADGHASIRSGSLQTIDYPKTIADGLRALALGDRNWAIIRKMVADVALCSEDQIRRAMAAYAVFMKLFVEPSGAVSLASLMAQPERFAGKTVVLYISGGNMALSDYAKLVTDDVSTFE